MCLCRTLCGRDLREKVGQYETPCWSTNQHVTLKLRLHVDRACSNFVARARICSGWCCHSRKSRALGMCRLADVDVRTYRVSVHFNAFYPASWKSHLSIRIQSCLSFSASTRLFGLHLCRNGAWNMPYRARPAFVEEDANTFSVRWEACSGLWG